jgi:two-component system NtrC family sensor kinase
VAAADDRPETVPPELALARRMRALGFLADGVAHDLANPLGAILAFASLLAADERIPPDLRTDATLLRDEAARTYRLVSTLLEVARTRPPSVRATPLAPVVHGLLELAAYPLTAVEVAVEVSDDLPDVDADPSGLRQWSVEALVEAAERLGAPSARGRLVIEATVVTDGSDGRDVVRLAITDHPEDREPHVAAIELPVHVAGATAAGVAGSSSDGQSPRTAPPDRPRPVVLVCDDEGSVRALLGRVLERAGCEAVEAASGEEALILVETAPIDAVVSDHRLPGITGIELFERLADARPELAARFVLLSGDPENAEVAAFTRRSGVPVLAKPFDLGQIESAVRRVVLPVTTA